MKLVSSCILLLSSSSLLVAASPTSRAAVPKSATTSSNSPQSKTSGHTYSSSRTSQSSTTSRSSAHPASTSLDPEYKPYDWMKLGCKSPTATDETMDPKERWDNSGTVHAWGAAFSHWLKHDSDRKFSQSLSDFYGGPPNVFCGEHLGDETNCRTVPDCSENAAHGFNSSAGYLITRSMFTLNQAYFNIWNAFNQAKDLTNLVDMKADFGPVTDHVTRTKVTADVFLLVFGVSMGSMWNKWFKKLPAGKAHPNGLGSTKDKTNAALTQSLAILKDTSKAGSELAKWEKATEIMSSLHESWVGAISTEAENMFNGSSTSVGELYNHIRDGQLLELDDPAGTKEDDVEEAKVAYATFIIPEIWATGDSAPVILDTGESCSNGKNDVTDKWIKTWLPAEKALKDYWACVDGKTYYLVNAPGKGAEGCNGGDCKTVQFASLPGTDKLKRWGIDFRDIITGSVKSYKANDNKNGYKMGDMDTKMLGKLIDDKYTTPGIFTLPVCGEDEAGDNWWAHSNNGKGRSPKHYPCD